MRKIVANVNKLFVGSLQNIKRVLHLRGISSHLFIVGAQKAGTSALYSYIENHPRIVTGGNKEPGYFSRDAIFQKGPNYYRSLFPVRAKNSYALDATPEYLYYRFCADRIHAFDPDAKIVILLREPVSRAYSAFNMYRKIPMNEWFKKRLKYALKDVREFFMPIAEGKIKPDLFYFLEKERLIIDSSGEAYEPSLIRRGIYAPQLERYIHLFGRQNVLVLFSDELKYNTKSTVKRVLDFAGLETSNMSNFSPQHVGIYSSEQGGKELTAKYANEYFAKDRLDLLHMFDIKVPW